MNKITYEDGKQASKNTKFHCLYGYFFLHYPIEFLATLYNKHVRTIRRWIKSYKKTGSVDRKARNKAFLTFKEMHQNWLVSLYQKIPILHLHEAKKQFLNKFGMTISASSISVTLRDASLMWHSFECRAIQLHDEDILRFSNELWNINWL